ncbi:MAG: biotin/lipoyl-binding protein [Bacteroidales bacterium]|nr:biotin/lipoyl-binding protein [Bacteroidales bacterium]
MKHFKFKIRGNQYNVDILKVEENEVTLEVNGTSYSVGIEREVKTSKTPTIVRKRLPDQEAPKPKPESSLKSVLAPLPGNIFKMLVSEGQQVKKGETLLIMEAMKMENNILSEFEGTVHNIKVKEGAAVLQNDLLLEIK